MNFKKMDICEKTSTIKVQRENHFDELMSTLKYFALTGVVTDLSFVTGDEIIQVHHIIFSCFSSYFENIKMNSNAKYFIYVDKKKIILEALVNCIYTGVAYIPWLYKEQFAMIAASFHIGDFISSTNNDIDDHDHSAKTSVLCQNHKSRLFCHIWNARHNSTKSDVMFVLSNKEKVFAHTCILSACSSFLLQIFTSCGVDQSKPYVVAMNNVKKTHLELVLEYCYKGEAYISVQDIQAVYNVADLLGIDTLCKLLLTKYPATSAFSVPFEKKEKNFTNIMRTSAIPKALADLLRCERLVDVFIFTSEKLFKAHSVILSLYCVFFKELANYLNYDFKNIIILIKDFQTKHMEAFLNYVYTGETKFDGNEEEFSDSLSEWLDLNVLPVSSSSITQKVMPSTQTITEDCEYKTKQAVKDDTVVILKNVAENGTENTKRTEKAEDCQGKCGYAEKERFAKSEKKNHLFVNEEAGDNASCDKEGSVFERIDNVAVCVQRKRTVINDIIPEHAVMKIENECGELSNETGMNILRSKSERDAMLIDSSMLSNTGLLKRAENRIGTSQEKHSHSQHNAKNLRDSSRKNIESKSCLTRVMKQSVQVGNQMGYNIVRSERVETEESDIDEPEIQETEKTREKADDLFNNDTNVMKKSKKRIFECQTCNEKFETREFRVHLSEHPTGNVLQCKLCLKVLSKPSELQNHLRTHTGARPLQCDICGMSFTGKNTLRKHEHTHTDKKVFECEVCNKMFSRKQYLQEHKRTHTGSKPYVCDICHKSFVGKTGLNHHKKTHKSADEKNSAVCEICGKNFTRRALWTHMKHHNKEYKCEICSKCFATPAALKIHVDGAHLGHSWHHCNICSKGFIRKAHLVRHMKTHEEKDDAVFLTCSQCPSKFKDNILLKAHMRRKHPEENCKSLKCGICNKHFPTQSTLMYHQRLHFHERPHRCNICSKSFAMPYLLRDHTRLHHCEEKLFPCSVCKKRCATQTLLNRHLLTHRPTFTPKSKPPGSFSCSSCSKIFPTKLALSNHSRSHSFSRPYQCNVCRKAFRYQDSLIRHLRLHPNTPTSEATAPKELPCIYTIQVCRPSFVPVNSDIVDNNTYANEKEHDLHDLPCSNTTVIEPAREAESSACLNSTDGTGDGITVLQFKPVEENYLSHTLLQTDEVGYTSLPPMDTNSICDVTVEKSPDLTSLQRRPYSITIDGNLCCNSALSTDGDITPTVTLLPERSNLEISDIGVGMTVPSHVVLPVTPSTSMVELSHLTVPVPTDQATHEFILP